MKTVNEWVKNPHAKQRNIDTFQRAYGNNGKDIPGRWVLPLMTVKVAWCRTMLIRVSKGWPLCAETVFTAREYGRVLLRPDIPEQACKQM